MDKDIDRKCCDTCKHYKWYYDKCSKYNCETDARARCSEYEHISELKEKDKLTCDRNICLKNEYNNIGCEDCVVTKNDVIEELEKIKEEFEEIKGLRDNPYNNETEYSVSMEELRELLDKHIAELKGIVDRIEEPVKKAISELKGENK